MTDVFGGDQSNENAQAAPAGGQPAEDWVAKLAEARGEKWSDPQVIAKGKLEADQHIANLEKQLAEMREDIAKNDYASKVLAALENKGQNSAGETRVPNQNTGDVSNQNTTDSANVDIGSLVEKKMTELQKQSQLSQNIEMVTSHLESQFGTEATKVVAEKAKELGLSLDKMKEMAGESPKAFLALVGSAPMPERNANVSSSRNTQATAPQHGVRNFAYWQKMRRENPNQYYKPSVQNEMAQEAARMGSAFYS